MTKKKRAPYNLLRDEDGKPYQRHRQQDLYVGFNAPIGFVIKDVGRRHSIGQLSAAKDGWDGRRIFILPHIFGCPEDWEKGLPTERHALLKIRKVLEDLLVEVDETLESKPVKMNYRAWKKAKELLADLKIDTFEWKLKNEIDYNGHFDRLRRSIDIVREWRDLD